MSSEVAVQEPNRNRLARAGKLKFGVFDGRRPKAISTWRLMSPNEDLIRQAAEVYGGTPKEFHHDRANPPDQWELITEQSTLDVWIPPNAIDRGYEQWTTKGMSRWCDGTTSLFYGGRAKGDTSPPPEVACACDEPGWGECKRKLRFMVILPQLTFTGGWMVETSSDEAFHAFPAASELMRMVQDSTNLIAGELALEKRSKAGGSKQFTIPVLRGKFSPAVMASGSSNPAVAALNPRPAAGELGATPPPQVADGLHSVGGPDVGAAAVGEDDIVEAELVEPGPGMCPACGDPLGDGNPIVKRDGAYVHKECA